jgi:hypothetical protein
LKCRYDRKSKEEYCACYGPSSDKTTSDLWILSLPPLPLPNDSCYMMGRLRLLTTKSKKVLLFSRINDTCQHILNFYAYFRLYSCKNYAGEHVSHDHLNTLTCQKNAHTIIISQHFPLRTLLSALMKYYGNNNIVIV